MEDDKTNIYVKGELFRQCSYLLINIPIEEISSFDELESIDEAAEKLDRSMEGHRIDLQIPPELEFWGHCSNLQVWYEQNYDTRLLHRNLAFPLLKELSDKGDPTATKAFKEEIAKRIESGHPIVVIYLVENEYFNYFNKDELDSFLGRDLHSELSRILLKMSKGADKDIKKQVYKILCDFARTLSDEVISEIKLWEKENSFKFFLSLEKMKSILIRASKSNDPVSMDNATKKVLKLYYDLRKEFVILLVESLPRDALEKFTLSLRYLFERWDKKEVEEKEYFILSNTLEILRLLLDEFNIVEERRGKDIWGKDNNIWLLKNEDGTTREDYVTYKGKKYQVINDTLIISEDIEDISELIGLENLTNLRELYLFYSKIKEINGIGNLRNLTYLSIPDSQITEINGLEELNNLRKLELEGSQITQIKGLNNLKKLKFLYLSANKITEIKGLDSLVKLETLWLDRNSITELKGLENLRNLKEINLNLNTIKTLKIDDAEVREIMKRDPHCSGKKVQQLVEYCKKKIEKEGARRDQRRE